VFAYLLAAQDAGGAAGQAGGGQTVGSAVPERSPLRRLLVGSVSPTTYTKINCLHRLGSRVFLQRGTGLHHP
jgi:hypothetical protein